MTTPNTENPHLKLRSIRALLMEPSLESTYLEAKYMGRCSQDVPRTFPELKAFDEEQQQPAGLKETS